MDKVALFWENIFIYWHGVFMTAAILITLIFALIFCKKFCKGSASELLTAAIFSIPLGILGARALYCICNYTEFSKTEDILHMNDGGYALYGGIFGVFLAVLISRIFSSRNKIGSTADCIAAGGALGIVAGRMASYFSYDNVGITIIEEKYHIFPLSVYDPASEQWFLATFAFEAVAELIIFLVLWVTFARNNNQKRDIRGHNGDIALLFLMMHGALTALSDSMHTDAVRFPFNSFVRVQQIIGAACMVIIMFVFLFRSVKTAHKFRFYHFIMPLLVSGMTGIAAYMEFDRISDTNYFFNHLIMFAALLTAVLLTLNIYKSTLKKSNQILP